MAHLQQELQVRAQLLKVGTPSLCVTFVIFDGEGLGLDDCAGGEDDLLGPLQRKSQTSKLWQLLQTKGGTKTLWGGGKPIRRKGERV